MDARPFKNRFDVLYKVEKRYYFTREKKYAFISFIFLLIPSVGFN